LRRRRKQFVDSDAAVGSVVVEILYRKRVKGVESLTY
jgi:hypothetical protein